MRIVPVISKEEIAERVRQAARQIGADYRGKDLVIVAVLKGAICFVADLIRGLDIPFHLETVQCSSYGHKGEERGEVQIFGQERLSIHNRDILLIDDIFDSGHTLDALARLLQQMRPRSLKTCVLLRKNIAHVVSMVPDYVLFPIENLFVVGYGLDYKEEYRGLPGIFRLEKS